MKLADLYPDVLELVAENMNLQEVMDAYKNPNRKRILGILEKSKKPLNIRDVSKKLTISYKSTYNNVLVLERAGLIKLKKDINASGQAITLEYIGMKKVLNKIKKKK